MTEEELKQDFIMQYNILKGNVHKSIEEGFLHSSRYLIKKMIEIKEILREKYYYHIK